jgi:hypothetical protein
VIRGLLLRLGEGARPRSRSGRHLLIPQPDTSG